MIDKKRELLENWHRGLRILHKGNFAAATLYHRSHRLMGILVIIFTSIAGSSIFSTAGKVDQEVLQITAGVFALCATVLASLQTFLGYSEFSEKHKEAAIKYGDLRMEVQTLLAKDLNAMADIDDTIENIRKRWSETDKISPTLPQFIYNRESRLFKSGKSGAGKVSPDSA